MEIVLASSSSYRKSLLKRLRFNFYTHNPDIDETAFPGETADELAERLSLAKAKQTAQSFPNALIIGSDQVAVLNGQILGKPGSAERAEQQLQSASGQTLQFITGICLFNSADENYQLDSVPFEVEFRELSNQQIKEYVKLDQPLDCAGSFKWESLGISLFKRMHGNDVTALEGLPLIRLVDMLQQAGVKIL